MPDEDLAIVRELMRHMEEKRYPKNLVRSLYYQSHYKYKGISYSIPDNMRDMAKPMIGWCNKSVPRARRPERVRGVRRARRRGRHGQMGSWRTTSWTWRCRTGHRLLLHARVQLHHRVRRPRRSRADPHDPPFGGLERRTVGSASAPGQRRADHHRQGTGTVGSSASRRGCPASCTRSNERRGPRGWRCEPIPTHLDRPQCGPVRVRRPAEPPRSAPAGSAARSWRSPISGCARWCAWRRPPSSIRRRASGSWERNRNQFSADTWSSIVSVINGLPSDKKRAEADHAAAPAGQHAAAFRDACARSRSWSAPRPTSRSTTWHHDGQSRVGRGDGRGRTQAQPHRRPSRTGVSAAR